MQVLETVLNQFSAKMEFSSSLVNFFFTVLRIGLGACLCVCYSAIFTKTNRIYRIFSGCMKGNQKPAYISPKSQLAICSGKHSVQFSLNLFIPCEGSDLGGSKFN